MGTRRRKKSFAVCQTSAHGKHYNVVVTRHVFRVFQHGTRVSPSLCRVPEEKQTSNLWFAVVVMQERGQSCRWYLCRERSCEKRSSWRAFSSLSACSAQDVSSCGWSYVRWTWMSNVRKVFKDVSNLITSACLNRIWTLQMISQRSCGWLGGHGRQAQQSSAGHGIEALQVYFTLPNKSATRPCPSLRRLRCGRLAVDPLVCFWSRIKICQRSRASVYRKAKVQRSLYHWEITKSLFITSLYLLSLRIC